MYSGMGAITVYPFHPLFLPLRKAASSVQIEDGRTQKSNQNKWHHLIPCNIKAL